jgi:hypothetical protein
MPRDLALDLYCGPCGEPNPPRLARFARRGDTGQLGTKVLTGGGQAMPHPPYRHVRPDGGATWHLRCPRGHFKPVREEHILAALDPAIFPPDTDLIRLPIF